MDIPSIIYYLVNYGIILAVLGFYVYPKIHTVLTRRQEEISGSLDDVHMLKEQLSKELQKYKDEHKRILEEARLQKKKSLEEVEAMKVQVMKEIEEKRSKSIEETQKVMEEKKAALLNDARNEIYTIMVKSFHTLSKKIPEAVITESIDEAWTTIHKS
ncbi:ATP synthase F0 subunit B [Candidatus Peribacteria bacterium]|nr:ATP synthase F0 subunit B [Candidatus Peribacteria bacterium]